MMFDVQLENGSLNETQTYTCLVSNMLSFLVNHLVIPIFRLITLTFFHLLEWDSKCSQYLYIIRIDLKSWYELNTSISFDTTTLHFVMFLSVNLYPLIKCLPPYEHINCEWWNENKCHFSRKFEIPEKVFI